MNFFEQELRKMAGHVPAIYDTKYVGQACFGKLTDILRIRMELVTQSVANNYTAVKATIINRNNGPVDILTLQFANLLGLKSVSNPNFKDGIYPYIWNSGDKIDWYVYKPTNKDYELISKALNDYIEMFSCTTLEIEQSAPIIKGQSM